MKLRTIDEINLKQPWVSIKFAYLMYYSYYIIYLYIYYVKKYIKL